MNSLCRFSWVRLLPLLLLSFALFTGGYVIDQTLRWTNPWSAERGAEKI